MTSYYITQEACDIRERALIARIAAEAYDLGAMGAVWVPESDFWRVPASVQQKIRFSFYHGESASNLLYFPLDNKSCAIGKEE